MSDLAFRRHILVQSLILIEFLLSLTPKAKSKISPESKNKAAMYSFEFLDDEVCIFLAFLKVVFLHMYACNL